MGQVTPKIQGDNMAKKIVVYSSPYCTYCIMAKNFLKKHNVTYQDINVQEDEQAARYIADLTQQTTIPVIIIDDKEVLIGFDEEKLKKALDIKE